MTHKAINLPLGSALTPTQIFLKLGEEFDGKNLKRLMNEVERDLLVTAVFSNTNYTAVHSAGGERMVSERNRKAIVRNWHARLVRVAKRG